MIPSARAIRISRPIFRSMFVKIAWEIEILYSGSGPGCRERGIYRKNRGTHIGNSYRARNRFSGTRRTDTSCKRSAERVKRATERQRTPHPSPKPDLKSCALRVTASSTPRHAASLDMYHARMSLLPLACWRSPISIGVSILERACAAIFFSPQKKRAGLLRLPERAKQPIRSSRTCPLFLFLFLTLALYSKTSAGARGYETGRTPL